MSATMAIRTMRTDENNSLDSLLAFPLDDLEELKEKLEEAWLQSPVMPGSFGISAAALDEQLQILEENVNQTGSLVPSCVVPSISNPSSPPSFAPSPRSNSSYGARSPAATSSYGPTPPSTPGSYGMTPPGTPYGPTPPGTPRFGRHSPYGQRPSNPLSEAYGAKNNVSQQQNTALTKQKIPRHKRESHINAEHRRRGKIKHGYEEIRRLVPAITEGSNNKDSKSNMLNKTAEYCRQLRADNKGIMKEAEGLRQEIAALTRDINHFQEELPAAGVELSRPSSPGQVGKMFDDYLRARIFQNWKFWIFGKIFQPAFDAYNRSVTTGTVEEFSSSMQSWCEQNLSLVSLRPAMLNTLRDLSKETQIMTHPERLPEEAIKAAIADPAPTKDESTS